MIREFVDKAHANLSAAQLCFENDLLDAAANRAYYAAFQAAVAGLDPTYWSRNPSGIQRIMKSIM